jgi:cobalt/nickel transport system permease protein
LSEPRAPVWLRKPEPYRPRPDGQAFIDRSIDSFLRLLSMLRARAVESGLRFNVPLSLASVILFILLLSFSRSMLFISSTATVLLVLLSLSRAELILRVVRVALPAAIFSFLLMLPSALWGNAAAAIVISLKVFQGVAAVKLLSSTMELPDFTRGLRVFFIPDVLILVLDLTLRYVSMLGELSLEMLHALRLRSVGRIRGKTSALSGIPGTIFLRSREAAEDTRSAMECRCFTGSYGAGPAPGLHAADALLFVCDGAILAGFILAGA